MDEDKLKEKMKEIHKAINVCECVDNHKCSVCEATDKTIDKLTQ